MKDGKWMRKVVKRVKLRGYNGRELGRGQRQSGDTAGQNDGEDRWAEDSDREVKGQLCKGTDGFRWRQSLQTVFIFPCCVMFCPLPGF